MRRYDAPLRIMKLRDRQILNIALPSIVSNITVPLLGLIDVAITGHMGSAAFVGAIAVGGMLFNIIYWLFVFLRMGTSGMTAQAFGARHMTEVVTLLVRAVSVAIALSVILLCIQVPVRELSLAIISPSPEVAALARTYFNICVWGAPASLVLFVLTGWFLGMQNSRAPMAVAIIQNVANIVLSLVLVYGFGMKIEGVAIGTVGAQYVGLVSALIFLFYGYRRLAVYRPVYLDRGKSRGEKRYALRTEELPGLARFFMLNKDIFLRTLCLIFVHFFFISAGAKQGDSALAVNALMMQLYLLYSYIMDGFAFAGEAMVGKAIGAKAHDVYMDTVKRLFVWGTFMMVVFVVLYSFFGDDILTLLTDDSSVREAAKEYHWWTLLLPVCSMAAFIWDGIYIGATNTKGMLISMASGMVTFFVLYMSLSSMFGNHALWLAFNGYMLMRGLSQTLLFKKSLV